jgi:hypothetical protein
MLLAERKQAWDEHQETVDYFEQKAELPGLEAGERPTLQEVHSQVLQDVALRLRKAFDAFFRHLSAGGNAGLSAHRLTWGLLSDCAVVYVAGESTSGERD